MSRHSHQNSFMDLSLNDSNVLATPHFHNLLKILANIPISLVKYTNWAPRLIHMLDRCLQRIPDSMICHPLTFICTTPWTFFPCFPVSQRWSMEPNPSLPRPKPALTIVLSLDASIDRFRRVSMDRSTDRRMNGLLFGSLNNKTGGWLFAHMPSIHWYPDLIRIYICTLSWQYLWSELERMRKKTRSTTDVPLGLTRWWLEKTRRAPVNDTEIFSLIFYRKNLY